MIATSENFPLKNSFLLDSASSIHVSRSRERFTNFRKAPPGHYAICGSGSVPILGYGEIDIELSDLKRRIRILRLHDVAFCPVFPTNLASLNLLEGRGIDWSHRDGKIALRGDTIGYTRKLHHQYVIEQSQPPTVLATTKIVRPRKAKTQTSWAKSDIWHLRMGHVGPAALSQLGKQTLGVRIRGPSTAKCSDCALAKITQQISRRPDPNKSTRPFHRIHIDWFDLEHGWDGYQPDGKLVRRCVIITCEATGMILTYFTTCPKEDENLQIIKDAVNYLKLRYNLEVKIVRSDNEMNRIKTKKWFNQQGIDFECCAPETHEQNGISERMGRLIMEKARAMRLSAKLPHALWKEIVATAAYLYNRTPRHPLAWKSPYETLNEHVMTSEGVTGPRKPILHHLRAYGCKAFTLIKSKGDPDYPGKLRKLAPKAHIGYLVGYESTSIYRVWIPHKRKVISTRDVIFCNGAGTPLST